MKRRGGLLSRSGESSPLGKLTFEVPKTKLDEQTGEVVTKRRQALGLSLSEYVRLVLQVHAHGVDHLNSLQRARLEVVARMGKEIGGR